MLEKLVQHAQELSERDRDWVEGIDATAGASGEMELSAKQEKVIRTIYQTYTDQLQSETKEKESSEKSVFPSVTIYTDGSSRGNPGRGGYGTILMSGKLRRELSGGFRHTTNNRMEIIAVIVGLEALKRPCEITVHSDSKYVVDTIEKRWLDGWKRKGWVNSKKERVKNKDLWLRFDKARASHKLTMKWVKGHAGNSLNERCDQLATSAADKPNQPADIGFEATD
jgi:ribonuclease HI